MNRIMNPMKTKLQAVNIHHQQGFEVYCGRPGKGIVYSPLQNPFKGGGAIEKFRLHLWRKIKARDNNVCFALLLIILKTNTFPVVRLGCFCKPKPCHVDVIINALCSIDVLNILGDFLDSEIEKARG